MQLQTKQHGRRLIRVSLSIRFSNKFDTYKNEEEEEDGRLWPSGGVYYTGGRYESACW